MYIFIFFGKLGLYLFFFQVVVNVVVALFEISEFYLNSNLFDLNLQNINKLLIVLNECIEWGQIFILDCLFNYNFKDDREVQRLVFFFLWYMGVLFFYY